MITTITITTSVTSIVDITIINIVIIWKLTVYACIHIDRPAVQHGEVRRMARPDAADR